ncbi:MAG: gluconolactonase [Acidimicrobiaceae bacterium]|nr:gluconolactonase [Acidimicrobiaceae bacterium]
MTVRAEVAAANVNYPEGPIVLPDGAIAFVETGLARVSAWRDGAGVEPLCVTGGGPNGLTLGSDGMVYVAQNGIPMGDVPFAPPSVQRFALGGQVEVVATVARGMTGGAVGRVAASGPNDLAFGPDGRLYVSDPARDRAAGPGRLLVFGADDSEVRVELAGAYINGVGFDAEGRLLWAESYDCYMARHDDADSSGYRRFADLPADHMPDGFAAAEDGRIFIATCHSHAITVISPDGEVVDMITLDAEAVPSNCCFDGSVLWVTDYTTDPAATGRLWRVETDAVGIPLNAGTLSPQAQ